MSQTRPLLDVHSHATYELDGMEAGINLPFHFVPPWSVERTLEIQDEVGISSCILSMPEGGTHLDDRGNAERARMLNEFMKGVSNDHPARFGTMTVLPLTNIDDALAELAYALDELGMDAVSLPTSVGGVYLGDTFFDPLFEELNRRRATVFVHPTMPEQARPLSLGLNQAMMEYVFDTTRMITNMIFSGAVRRFSEINLIASHGDGTFPYILTRLMTLEPLTGPGPDREMLTPEEIKQGAAWFHYDLTAATSRAQLTGLTEIVGTDHLLAGFDIPYLPVSVMPPMVSAIEEWFSPEEVTQIMHTNAARLFPSVEARRAEGAK